MLNATGKVPEVTEQPVMGPPLETTLWLADLPTVSVTDEGE